MRSCSAFLLLLFSVTAPAAPPQNAYDVKKLADGVYGFIWREPLQNPIQGNSLFIINDRDVVVVDAGLFPSSAEVMIRELKKLTPNPVRYVVNTHFHDDHNNGNFLYRQEWPAVEFIAHRATREDILEQVIRQRPQDIQGFRDHIAQYRSWLDSGKDDGGKPLDSARTTRVKDVIALYERSIAEYGAVRDAPPELIFGDSLVLHRGDRTIEILWLGRGNTRGDAVVFLPKERIAATGDLLVYPIPFGYGSFYSDWAATLARLDSLGADVLFLGHGPPQGSREYLRLVEGMLRDLVSEVSEAVASGRSLEETRNRVTLKAWEERFAKGDPAAARSFEQFFVAPAVEGAWQQAQRER